MKGELSWRALRSRCAQELEAQGHFLADWTREAFEAVPREAFVPSRVWWPESGADGSLPLLDRAVDPAVWAQAVYAPETALITQIDDGAVSPHGPGKGRFTSSISAPHIALRCLGHLDLGTRDRVLEIGTGTGYNTALLSERAGDEHVTSLEVDSAIAVTALGALRSAGYLARVACGDGEVGCAAGAPYDRVLATVGVSRVPYAWVRQCAPGGVIVVPYRGSALLRMVVNANSTGAVGRCVDTAAFMVMRGQRRPMADVDALIDRTLRGAERWRGDVMLDELADSLGAQFFSHLRVPSVRMELGARTWWFTDARGSSWAAWKPGGLGRQWGERRLLDEVCDAFTLWREAGRPDLARFGVTVAEERECVWLDEPDNLIGMAREAP